MNRKWKLTLVVGLLLISLSAAYPDVLKQVPNGKLENINGTKIVSVWGTPKQMGTAYGTLLGPVIKRVIRDMITDGIGSDKEAYENIMKGSRVMALHQPKEFLEELKAVSEAADVNYDDLVLLQYFGDVRRCIKGAGSSTMCTSFAVLPPRTKNDSCIVGRNLDYFDNGVSEYAAILAYYKPEGKIPFVTVTWAGINNGWTLINEKGIVVSNNTPFEGKSGLEGIATCNMLRYVAENAGSVEEGLKLVKDSKRACPTLMLIASGKPADAAVAEYDHDTFTAVKDEDGFVGGANGFEKLYQPETAGPHRYYGRIGKACELVKNHEGKIDIDFNIAGTEGVPISGMNLHSIMINATEKRFRVAMGKIPAYKLEYKEFRLTEKGVEQDAVKKEPAFP